MTEPPLPRFGFVEIFFGRNLEWPGLAMLGFVIGLGTELLTGQGILTQDRLGLNLKHYLQSCQVSQFLGPGILLGINKIDMTGQPRKAKRKLAKLSTNRRSSDRNSNRNADLHIKQAWKSQKKN